MPAQYLVSPDGIRFRDLNGNGTMEPYENPTLPVEERIRDLIVRMSIEEKSGLMMLPALETTEDGSFVEGDRLFSYATTPMLTEQYITHVSALQLPDPRNAARWTNRLQDLALTTPLGIPITVFTDPRNGFAENIGAALAAGAFSQWPESLGFGAIGDADLVEQFADIARQEYAAVGIRGALHPQIDLATEPRWARQNGGFGSSADVAEAFAAAYIRGFQGERLGEGSVSCMAKHFPGGGPQLDGEDPHFKYGREQVYPGGQFDYHLRPFQKAIEQGVAAMMPYYGMPVDLQLPDGTPVPEVAFGFNQTIITRLLREQLGYDGVVCTDYTIVSDMNVAGLPFPARAWGVEHLSPLERVEQVILAGCDQFGGEAIPELIVELVRAGRVSEDRINESVRRLLRVKFALGLFDDPYVDEDTAEVVVGRADFRKAGLEAQRRSLTLLTNGTEDNPLLPLAPGTKVYAPNLTLADFAGHRELVSDIDQADVALVRLRTPYDPRNTYFLEAKFHAGDLQFDRDTEVNVAALAARVPVIVDLYLDRPAILGEIRDSASAIIANYGCSAQALIDVLFGDTAPEGHLPYDLPRSMAAVQASRSDVPDDTENPVFRRGHGLTFFPRHTPAEVASGR